MLVQASLRDAGTKITKTVGFTRGCRHPVPLARCFRRGSLRIWQRGGLLGFGEPARGKGVTCLTDVAADCDNPRSTGKGKRSKMQRNSHSG